METARPASLASPETVRVTNPGGSSPFVLTCDHASNFLPPEFGTLGLAAGELSRHIAWDPGALPVARRMAEALDATLVETRISRLVIDCNRPLDAPDLVPPVSETTAIPGNAGLTAEGRARRIALAYDPFHAAIEDVISERQASGRQTWLVAVHSFTPVYKGVPRPWEIGIIHDDDTSLAAPLIAALRLRKGLAVGVNEPYSPADRVYHTLEIHGRRRGLPCAMIEIRNDEISGEEEQQRWAGLLTSIMRVIEPQSRRDQMAVGTQMNGRQNVD
ncbi:MAG: N-formylglutamate amidohydrolase [Mesorhizobium sp.]|uniref:N-formylglutamate amidohydrolase n=1 Tax=unclassified Mesorhizobium TaxID=325217 RepID=UPI000FCB3858|nr:MULTISPECIES: N-formylglutamate amidohydrolase [unclassified Mesorhizobium]RUV71253.1 N-formylglutamate amidohydrolase [Mesorhizobium sp. M5C.F.Cr.IN.023.01.1.1]RWF82676.1 MAG: N-formylglutamate amidohydrolase [Mesorhizobium sp.]RWF94274.1 MAG: N-formylglutamate amidohydrolase [Mesorhizobium sp.]RWI33247.1 MAG: N-formylglutamate amidohydrolase [Mesorhizobium sp.]RWI42957.1 MAG: N-formylglutamate amidohydrolase [Mesorhizobium sp.]